MKFAFRILLFACIPFSLVSCDEEDDPPVSSGIIFEDQCNKTSEWPVFSDETAAGNISNGFYEFEHKIDDANAWYSIYLTKDLYGNYTMETAIKQLETSDDFYYGMMFLRKDNYNHYYFYIKDQQYEIGYIYNYNDNEICPLTPSAAINPTGISDTLKVKKTIDHLDFYINNVRVYEFDMTNYVGDEFGFKLISKGKVAIDYFKIYK